jgi:cardiolipin synthase
MGTGVGRLDQLRHALVRPQRRGSLNVYSREFGSRMTAVMEADLRHANRYTAEMWRRRPLRQKLGELLVRPLESQL